jgi:PKD repeat protein
MKDIEPRHSPAAVVLLLALVSANSPAFALPGYGENVDDFCSRYDGSTPFADMGGNTDNQGCLLCHTGADGSGRVGDTWNWYLSGDYASFCVATAPNQAPNGTITAPSRNLTITTNGTVQFQGVASDPDGDPVTFHWEFGVSTATGPGPHVVTYPDTGAYTARLIVTDSGGLSDPTPDSRIITVNAELTCTDLDGDGFAIEGGGCGALDCNDADPSINPNATEFCGDGIDNDCDNLIDNADPLAVGCSRCLDADGDLFSPEGGSCGPEDCDDTDPAINPGAHESCEDGTDNDCDFYIDDTDSECHGSDCIGQLLQGDGSAYALQVSWEADRDPAEPLDGARVAGAIYVFIPAVPGIAQVRFFLNGELRRTENLEPWDFAGGTATVANPLQSAGLTNGIYSMIAEVDLDSGETLTSVADFEVDNGDLSPIGIASATWESSDRELEVEGYWRTAGAAVRVFNAYTGALLGTTSVGSDDGRLKWEFEREDMSPAPCRVRVEIEGRFGEREVDDAPADCR